MESNDKHIAETDSSFSWLRASSVCVRDVITVMGEGNIKILHNRSEVFSFLQKILPQTRGTLYMFTEEMSESIIELLAMHLQRDDFRW